MNKKQRGASPSSKPPLPINTNFIEYDYYTIKAVIYKYAGIILLLAVLLGYFHTFHYKLLVISLYGLVIIFMVISISGLIVAVAFLREKILIIRAGRLELEKQAHTLTIVAGNQVYLRETNPKATIKALHLQQTMNGQSPTTADSEQWLSFITSHQKVKQPPLLDTPLLEDTASDTIPLLDHLDTADRVLVKGQSGAGKTNLLYHVANQRLNNGMVYVLDPHASPNKWGACKVVGAGADYVEMSTALDYFLTEMVERYQQLRDGTKIEGEFVPLTIIIDEFMSISGECKNAKNVLVRLITESRKANFSLFIGTHSDRVESLGLKGQGDIRDGLVFVRLYKAGSARSASVDYGQGELDAKIPPLFNGWENLEANHSSDLIIPTTPPLTSQDLEILTLYNEGLSVSKIAIQILGNKGGVQNNLVRETIAKGQAIQAKNGSLS